MPETELEVRPFTAADELDVISLWNEVFPHDPPWNEPEELIRLKKTVQPEMFFVACLRGRIVGTVLSGYDGTRGGIHHLAVHPSQRRNGVATRLMQVAEDALRRRGCPKVNLQIRLENGDVVAFYRALGYDVEQRISMGKRLHTQGTNLELKEALARKVMQTCLLRGEFRLRSGRNASEYFDKYRFESDPFLLRAIAQALTDRIPKNTQLLAGLELGGIPLATAIALETGLPVLFVRKKAKEYGTRGTVEGGEAGGKKIVVIEDVVTSGGQVLESSQKLKKYGAAILCVLCVVDREAGGAESLAAAGLELRSLFKLSELRKFPEDS